MEKECRIEVYGIENSCERCGRGSMMLSADIPATLTTPPLYTHHCNKCGVIAKFPAQYPKIMYRMLDKD